MEFVILKFEEIYSPFGNYKYPIYQLGLFLTDDCGSDIDFFKKWLENPNYLKFEGNITWLEKWDDNIIIGFLFYDFEEDKYKDVVTISKEEFVKVLDRWKELRQQRPNYIKITNDNGKIIMEGRKQVEDAEYLKLQLNTNKYSVIETTQTKIKFFGTFLTNDFPINLNSLIAWVNDGESHYKINGKACIMRRAEYEILITELILEHNPGSDYTFYIKKNQFIETLNKLHELFNKKVKEISITYKDDIYTIEAID